MAINTENTKEQDFICDIISRLTLEEKISMIHGAGLFRTGSVERMDIPSLYMSDGPMGVRAEFADNEWRNTGTTDDFVSYLPCNSALASTWNRELAHAAGHTLGEETRGRGKDVILAPGINIKRSPLCGRNFEYMSEDPRLIEELVVPLIQGIQENDVAACVKHFAANSQETQRLWVDTLVDERTLNEIYFPGFKAAVKKGGVLSLMGAYNLLNGEHCCTSKKLLNDVLRDEWGFDGMVVSDWGGVHDTFLALNSALDIEMHTIYEFDRHMMAAPLLKAVKEGKADESLIDKKVENILRLMLRLNMIGENRENRKSGCYNTREHAEAALDTARESVILLKNDKGILPLDEKKVKTIAVIGENAVKLHSNGGGSAEIKALYEISPLMGIKKLLGGNCKVIYHPGYFVPKNEKTSDISWQADSTRHIENSENSKNSNGKNEAPATEISEKYISEVLDIIASADAVIYVGGLTHEDDVEGKDRENMTLPYGQDKLIDAILDKREDAVIVMCAGSPVSMPWVNKAHSILWSYYNGMEGGTALAEIIFGRVNPSGKLAESFIKDETCCPAQTIGTFAKEDVVEYREGVMVGYRYYDTYKTDVNFCFGHGLSYTQFEYSDIESHTDGDDVKISFTLKNTGSCPGKEAVQLYVSPRTLTEGVERPVHELKAFEKIMLEPKEEKQVAFILKKEDFSYYDTDTKRFKTVAGDYVIEAAASSRDIRLTAEINIEA